MKIQLSLILIFFTAVFVSNTIESATHERDQNQNHNVENLNIQQRPDEQEVVNSHKDAQHQSESTHDDSKNSLEDDENNGHNHGHQNGDANYHEHHDGDNIKHDHNHDENNHEHDDGDEHNEHNGHNHEERDADEKKHQHHDHDENNHEHDETDGHKHAHHESGEDHNEQQDEHKHSHDDDEHEHNQNSHERDETDGQNHDHGSKKGHHHDHHRDDKHHHDHHTEHGHHHDHHDDDKHHHNHHDNDEHHHDNHDDDKHHHDRHDDYEHHVGDHGDDEHIVGHHDDEKHHHVHHDETADHHGSHERDAHGHKHNNDEKDKDDSHQHEHRHRHQQHRDHDHHQHHHHGHHQHHHHGHHQHHDNHHHAHKHHSGCGDKCQHSKGSAAPIPTQSNFNLTKFLGVWYIIGETGESILEGAVTSLSQSEDGIALMHSGSRGNICVDPIIGVGQLRDGATLSIKFKGLRKFTKATYKIIETEYDEYALIYRCIREWPNGGCARQDRNVMIMSRKRTLESRVIKRLLEIMVAALGMDARMMHYTKRTVECPIPNTVNEQISTTDEVSSGDSDDASSSPVITGSGDADGSGGSGEVDDNDSLTSSINKLHNNETDPQKKVCKFDDVPTQRGFTPEKWIGEWYVLVAFRKSRSFDSAFAVLDLQSDGSLKSRFTGRRDGHCLPVFESRFIPDKKNPAVFTAKYLIYNDPLKVVYSDKDYVLTYQCVNPQTDGTCMKSMIFLTGRNPGYPEDARARFHTILHSLCTEEDLHEFESSHIGECGKKLSNIEG